MGLGHSGHLFNLTCTLLLGHGHRGCLHSSIFGLLRRCVAHAIHVDLSMGLLFFCSWRDCWVGLPSVHVYQECEPDIALRSPPTYSGWLRSLGVFASASSAMRHGEVMVHGFVFFCCLCAASSGFVDRSHGARASLAFVRSGSFGPLRVLCSFTQRASSPAAYIFPVLPVGGQTGGAGGGGGGSSTRRALCGGAPSRTSSVYFFRPLEREIYTLLGVGGFCAPPPPSPPLRPATNLPRQVDQGFDDEGAAEVQSLLASSGIKRKAGDLNPAVAEQGARQVAWLRRNRKGAKMSMWRPRKRYRLSAKRWAAHLDNQAPVLDMVGELGLCREA